MGECSPSRGDMAAAIMMLARMRGRGASFCPSEAARAVTDDWRPVMGEARLAAAELVAAGLIVATQKGLPVDPATARGAIRLRLA
jgi:hypothetical protein